MEDLIMGRAKILASAIHKGGSGKTTIAVNMVHYLHENGYRVLLVDMDTQRNACHGFMDIENLPEGIETASQLFSSARGHKVYEVQEGLGVIPSDGDELQAVERLPFETAFMFRDRLHKIGEDFDVIVIDTPPTMGFGMIAPLIAADYTFAPIIPDAYGLMGAKSLLSRIHEIQDDMNPDLEFLGLLINLWNKRDKDQNETVAQFSELLGEIMIPEAIGLRAPISRAARVKQPVWKLTRGLAAKEMKAALKYMVDQMELQKQQKKAA
jgi:chromosome partitioning protein